MASHLNPYDPPGKLTGPDRIRSTRRRNPNQVEGATEVWHGEGLIADESVVLGYPNGRANSTVLRMGQDARLRSGTVIYAGARIGDRFQSGHHVVVREETVVGDDVSIWSNSVVDYGCTIGSRVKIHSNCYLAQFTELEDEVFLAPGVTIANDLFPGNPASAAAMAGPLICRGAQVGVNATILPYVTIGPGTIVGAGAVVTRSLPALVVAFGNPAVPVGPVPDGDAISSRVRDGIDERFTGRQSAPRAREA